MKKKKRAPNPTTITRLWVSQIRKGGKGAWKGGNGWATHSTT